ncbi:MAG: 6,7-dimethyl-8-ribityllumazine synthase, partial [Varibaculum cambriense]|nr:6,7-dimethyl-8-ribityllumazine synthase [Varibaculum cambriense]
MAGAGVPDLHIAGAGKKVVIIATQWHEQVMKGLVAGAERACRDAKADCEVVRVPGSFELPLAAKAYAESGKADALV